jgi:hypothetical protein
MNDTLPYIDAVQFDNKVAKFAKTNLILKNLFNHPKSKIKSWQDLPPHLIKDLFKKLGCKPSIQKY